MDKAADFFRYQASTPESECWGVVVTGAGRFTARPGSPYPPAGHPRDHHFTWERGRALGSLQVVYISAGGGEAEFAARETRLVGAGDALLLRPGAWHRYRPLAASGWTEQWVELEGPVVQGLLSRGPLQAADPVVNVSRRLEFEHRLGAIQQIVAGGPAGHAPELAAQALGLLALIAISRDERQRQSPIAAAVAQARRVMEEAEGRELSMPRLARSLGVAYTHFRREFRRSTGMPPGQYLLRVRMQRVQRLLGSTDETLKEVAERLGFSSAFHLSSAFKARYGVSPSQWRRSAAPRDAEG